jgi:hypothetical protein
MKLLLIQSGILGALAGLVLCTVPTDLWSTIGWRGRAVDDVNRFLRLPNDPVWIRQTNPLSDQGSGFAGLNSQPVTAGQG